MSQPTVAAVMLVNGRDAMVRRAVECVRAQTYGSLSLLILDSAITPNRDYDEWSVWMPNMHAATIGELRNAANYCAAEKLDADIVVHFDSDDWSHPRRVEEQVALLEASGADAVGYNEALFWREPSTEYRDVSSHQPVVAHIAVRHPAEAWLYSNGDTTEMLGASLCYWRRVWERKPFAATSQGEDFRFRVGLKTVGVSTLPPTYNMVLMPGGYNKPITQTPCSEPRFIARIHAGNTSNAYAEDTMARASEWRRVAEWDAYCRERMAL